MNAANRAPKLTPANLSAILDIYTKPGQVFGEKQLQELENMSLITYGDNGAQITERAVIFVNQILGMHLPEQKCYWVDGEGSVIAEVSNRCAS